MATREIKDVTIVLGSTALGGFSGMDGNNQNVPNLIVNNVELTSTGTGSNVLNDQGNYIPMVGGGNVTSNETGTTAGSPAFYDDTSGVLIAQSLAFNDNSTDNSIKFNGGQSLSTKEVSGNYNVDFTTDHILILDTSSSPVGLTLPDVSTVQAGSEIVMIDGAGNAFDESPVIFSTAGQINNFGLFTIVKDYGTLKIKVNHDSSQYFISGGTAAPGQRVSKNINAQDSNRPLLTFPFGGIADNLFFTLYYDYILRQLYIDNGSPAASLDILYKGKTTLLRTSDSSVISYDYMPDTTTLAAGATGYLTGSFPSSDSDLSLNNVNDKQEVNIVVTGSGNKVMMDIKVTREAFDFIDVNYSIPIEV